MWRCNRTREFRTVRVSGLIAFLLCAPFVLANQDGDPGYFLSRLEQFVRENGIELRYSDEIAPARGMAERGKITLLPEQTPAETFATLVHEVAHLCGDEIYVALGAENQRKTRGSIRTSAT